MELTESRLLRQAGQGQRLIEVGIDPDQHVAFRARRQPSGDHWQTPPRDGVVLDQTGER